MAMILRERKAPVLSSPGQSRVSAGPSCPPSQDWALLAASLVSGPKAQQMLEHLAECEKCGVTLRLAAEAIHGEDAADSALGLVPATQDQGALAKRLAQVEEPLSSNKVVAMPSRSGIWKLGAIAAGIAVLVGSWWSRELSKPNVETLLAQAYTARRPSEFRMPGGTVAPVRMDRSPQATFAKPRPLMDAENQIAQALETNPRDGRWLKWKARAEMLEFQADEAISTLSRALEAQPNDAELQAELGAAYAQQAESEQAGAERDWSQALDKLRTQFETKLLANQGVLPLEGEEHALLAVPISDHEKLPLDDDEWSRLRSRVRSILREYLGQERSATAER